MMLEFLSLRSKPSFLSLPEKSVSFFSDSLIFEMRLLSWSSFSLIWSLVSMSLPSSWFIFWS